MIPALQGTNLYRFYHVGDDEVFALRGVSVTLLPGEFVAVMGPSGSGKSTLLRCLAGLEDPEGGRVEVGGQRISHQREADRARLRSASMGIMLQTGNLFPHLTVLENLELRRMLVPSRQIADPARLLEDVGLGPRIHAMPATLSGGEAARAALAVAMSVDPPVLLFDEPTAEVDLMTEAVVVAQLKERQRSGGAILVATHSAVLAEKADRVLKLADGSVT